jgi:hypothetical protein
MINELKGMSLIILDIEGSGGSDRRDPYGTGSIVSLGAVDFNTGREFYEECKVMAGRGCNDEALKVNGFTREQIFDDGKQDVLELLVKFQHFCTANKATAIASWGNYDLKMLRAAYSYYSIKWGLPTEFINLKDISKQVLGEKRCGCSNTAMKLGLPPEPKPHIAINGARLATELFSLLAYHRHFYKEYRNIAQHEKLRLSDVRIDEFVTSTCTQKLRTGL